jgi:hypothetical protein
MPDLYVPKLRMVMAPCLQAEAQKLQSHVPGGQPASSLMPARTWFGQDRITMHLSWHAQSGTVTKDIKN